MLIGSLFLLMLIPLVLLFTVGIPIIIGICVYRDASRRVDCSPWLWALVAALVPSCIGLVVYLIVRRDYPLKEEGAPFYSRRTGREDRDEYAQSPEPCFYGETEERNGLPTWAKALIIIGTVILLICMVAVVVGVLYSVFGYHHGTMNYYHQVF